MGDEEGLEMPRHRIASYTDLPEMPPCDNPHVWFHGTELLGPAQGDALSRALSARYGVLVDIHKGTEQEDGGERRFNALLSSLRALRLEHDDPEESRIDGKSYGTKGSERGQER